MLVAKGAVQKVGSHDESAGEGLRGACEHEGRAGGEEGGQRVVVVNDAV